jgi:hypothetical protein
LRHRHIYEWTTLALSIIAYRAPKEAAGQPPCRQTHRLCGTEQDDTTDRSDQFATKNSRLESFLGGTKPTLTFVVPNPNNPVPNIPQLSSHALIRHRFFLLYAAQSSPISAVAHLPSFPPSNMTDSTGQQHPSGPDATTQGGQSTSPSCEQTIAPSHVTKLTIVSSRHRRTVPVLFPCPLHQNPSNY